MDLLRSVSFIYSDMTQHGMDIRLYLSIQCVDLASRGGQTSRESVSIFYRHDNKTTHGPITLILQLYYACYLWRSAVAYEEASEFFTCVMACLALEPSGKGHNDEA